MEVAFAMDGACPPCEGELRGRQLLDKQSLPLAIGSGLQFKGPKKKYAPRFDGYAQDLYKAGATSALKARRARRHESCLTVERQCSSWRGRNCNLACKWVLQDTSVTLESTLGHLLH